MNFKTVLMALTVAAMAAFGTGCGSACDDLKDCCEAQGAQGCDLYDEADDDACQALIDAYETPEGADVPSECEF
jgi:hypothetical protein